MLLFYSRHKHGVALGSLVTSDAFGKMLAKVSLAERLSLLTIMSEHIVVWKLKFLELKDFLNLSYRKIVIPTTKKMESHLYTSVT